MKKIVLIMLLLQSIIFFTFITSCSLLFPKRELMPYNPSKAGATIEESFNISKSIGLKQLENNTSFTTRFALALYNNNMYVCISERIHVFDKNTFKKTNEIKINYPTDMPYPNDRPGRNVFSFIITNDGTAFLYSSYSTISYLKLWLLDLTTGNVVLMGNDCFPDFDQQEIKRFRYADYNRQDNTVRFLTWNNIYFFEYDADAKNFILLESKPRHRTSFDGFDGVSVLDDTIWYCGHVKADHNEWYYIMIQKFHIDQDKVLHTIDVEYLNTLTLPQSHLYDPPFIWLMVDRNNEIEMLKLLPLES